MRLKKLFPAGAAIVVIALIFSAYSNTFTSPPVLDDLHSFVENRAVHVERFDQEVLRNLVDSYFGIARLLPLLTFAFDFSWGMGSLAAFHVTNLVIHLLAFLACWWLTIAVLRTPALSAGEKPLAEPASRLFYALAISGLWALHPVQTSAVTYIVQRMASMQALFFFATCAAYVEWRLAWKKEPVKARFWTCILCGSAGAAFLSKENSAMLPVVLATIELWFFQTDLRSIFRERIWPRVRKPLPCALLVVCLVGIFLLGAFAFRHFASGYDGRHFSMAERLLTEARVVMRYIYAILVPNPSVLSIEHDVPVSRTLLSPPTTLPSILVIVSLIGVAIRLRGSHPIISFGLMWFFLNLVIESSIVPLELQFDHRMYLPSYGLVFTVSELFRLAGARLFRSWSSGERRKLAFSCTALGLAVFSLLTFSRNEDWRDVVTINRDAVEKAPHHPRAHANYASALAKVGRYDEAMAEAYKAIELGRARFESHFTAGGVVLSALMHHERWEEAIAEGERLYEARPERFDAKQLPVFLLKLAECYRVAGRYPEAFHKVVQVSKLTQDYHRLRDDRKWMYLVLNLIIADAAAKNIDVDGDGTADPGDLLPNEWIAKTLKGFGDYEGARIFALQATGSQMAAKLLRELELYEERNRQQSEAWWSFKNNHLKAAVGGENITLGLSYLILKFANHDLMKFIGEQLLDWNHKTNPWNPDTYTLRGWYAFERKDPRAAQEARQAVDLAPQSAKAWIALGFFEQRAGRVENALTAFRHSLELYPGYPKRKVLEELMAQLENQIASEVAERGDPVERKPSQHAAAM